MRIFQAEELCLLIIGEQLRVTGPRHDRLQRLFRVMLGLIVLEFIAKMGAAGAVWVGRSSSTRRIKPIKGHKGYQVLSKKFIAGVGLERSKARFEGFGTGSGKKTALCGPDS
jgi:hypothetical protein